MSDNEVQAPQGNLAQAPLSGLLQGFQFGAGLANQKQANADAAEQRQQQQSNLDRQFQFQQQQADTSNTQFNQDLEQRRADSAANQSRFDAQQNQARVQFIAGQKYNYMKDGLGEPEATARALHDWDSADQNHPFHGVPTIQLKGYPLPSVLHPGDPIYPANIQASGGVIPPGKGPIGKFYGPNGEHFADTPPNAGATAQVDTQSPASNVAQTAQGGGYAQLPPMGQPGPLAQPQAPQQAQPQAQAPQAQPAPYAPEQQPQIAPQPQTVPGMLNPMQNMMQPQGVAPSSPNATMGGGVPAPMGAPTPAPLPPVANQALVQQTQQRATQLLQQVPDLPGKPADDALPSVQQKWATDNQAYHMSIQAAADSHDGVQADLALKQAQKLETEARTKQLQQSIDGNKLSEALQNGLVKTQTDALAAKSMLDKLEYAHRVQQDKIENGFKAADISIRNALMQQARNGQQGSDKYTDIQNTYNDIYAHQQKTQKYVEDTQSNVNHTRNVLAMPASAFDDLKPDKNGNTKLLPSDKAYADHVKLKNEWDALHQPAPNPLYNPGAPQEMAAAGIQPTVRQGDILLSQYQRGLDNANKHLDTTTKILDYTGNQLKVLQGGDPNAAKKALATPPPAVKTTVTAPPANGNPTGKATAPSSSTPKAKPTPTPAPKPTGTKKAPPAKAPATPQKQYTIPGAGGALITPNG